MLSESQKKRKKRKNIQRNKSNFATLANSINLDPRKSVKPSEDEFKKCTPRLTIIKLLNTKHGTSLVVQWLRIHLAMQGIQICHMPWGN